MFALCSSCWNKFMPNLFSKWMLYSKQIYQFIGFILISVFFYNFESKLELPVKIHLFDDICRTSPIINPAALSSHSLHFWLQCQHLKIQSDNRFIKPKPRPMFFSNSLHSVVRHNTEENTWRYFSFSATVNDSGCLNMFSKLVNKILRKCWPDSCCSFFRML